MKEGDFLPINDRYHFQQSFRINSEWNACYFSKKNHRSIFRRLFSSVHSTRYRWNTEMNESRNRGCGTHFSHASHFFTSISVSENKSIYYWSAFIIPTASSFITHLSTSLFFPCDSVLYTIKSPRLRIGYFKMHIT